MTEHEYVQYLEAQIAEEVRKNYPGLDFFVSIDDPRYPKVIFTDNPDVPEFDNKGFWWDTDRNGVGANFCICNAFEPDECICGVWDADEDDAAWLFE